MVGRAGLHTFSGWDRMEPIYICAAPKYLETITINEFYELVYNYMKPCIDAADAGHGFDWCCLKQAELKFGKYLRNDVLLFIFAMFALGLCDEYKNVNNVGVETWLDFFIVAGLLWVDYPSFVPYIGRRRRDYRHTIYRVPNFMTIKYDNPATSWSVDPLLRAYLTGDLLATKILIKYGLVFYFPKIVEYEFNFVEIILADLRKSDSDFIDITSFRSRLDSYYPTEYEKRRMFFVVRAIYILAEMLKRNPRYLVLVEPLKLMFKTTPQPYIALDEVRKLLNLMTNKVRPERVEYLCKRYLECFRESRLPLRPRSLKHLSRWRVRECLREVRRLPLGVWSLGLPQTLKRYVLFQEDNRPYHSCFLDNLKNPHNPEDAL